MATQVLDGTSTTGEIIRDVQSLFVIRIIPAAVGPTSGTIPNGTYVRYAFSILDGNEIADADLNWTRASDDYTLDSALDAAQTKQFRPLQNAVYQVVTGTAGPTAELGALFI